MTGTSLEVTSDRFLNSRLLCPAHVDPHTVAFLDEVQELHVVVGVLIAFGIGLHAVEVDGGPALADEDVVDDLIDDAAGLDIHASILSKGIAGMAVKLLRFQSKFSGKEPLLTEFGLYNMTRNNDFDCSKAEAELDFHCRPFSETIRDEVLWLREEAANAPEVSEEAKKVAAQVQERVKLGDIKNIIVKKKGEVLFTMPVMQSIAVGIGSFLIVPYLIIPGAMIAYGQVTIELETKDGAILDICGKPIAGKD